MKALIIAEFLEPGTRFELVTRALQERSLGISHHTQSPQALKNPTKNGTPETEENPETL